MSASNYFETALLGLIFNANPIANVAQNAASAPATNLYISLHTADPGEAGTQLTSEATYLNYARVAVTRNAAGFTIAGNNASNTATITFPSSTGGSNVITHFGIGLGATGAGTLLFSGSLVATLAVSNGITPEFQPGELDTTAD